MSFFLSKAEEPMLPAGKKKIHLLGWIDDSQAENLDFLRRY